MSDHGRHMRDWLLGCATVHACMQDLKAAVSRLVVPEAKQQRDVDEQLRRMLMEGEVACTYAELWAWEPKLDAGSIVKRVWGEQQLLLKKVVARIERALAVLQA